MTKNNQMSSDKVGKNCTNLREPEFKNREILFNRQDNILFLKQNPNQKTNLDLAWATTSVKTTKMGVKMTVATKNRMVCSIRFQRILVNTIKQCKLMMIPDILRTVKAV